MDDFVHNERRGSVHYSSDVQMQRVGGVRFLVASQGDSHYLRQLVYHEEGLPLTMTLEETEQKILTYFKSYCELFYGGYFRNETGGNFSRIKEIRITTTKIIATENLCNFTKYPLEKASEVWRDTRGKCYKLTSSFVELLNERFRSVANEAFKNRAILLNATESIIAQFACDFTYEVEAPFGGALENELLSALKSKMHIEPAPNGHELSEVLRGITEYMGAALHRSPKSYLDKAQLDALVNDLTKKLLLSR